LSDVVTTKQSYLDLRRGTGGLSPRLRERATLVQRALIHELELVAFALFFAVTLAQNKIEFGVYFPGLKKK
jgi:hypothetical protein